MARQNKNLTKNPNERNHREHRTRTNYIPRYHSVVEFKRKKEDVIKRELDNNIEDVL